MIYLVNENDFKQKAKALKKYFSGTYLYFVKEILPKLKQNGKIDGVYEVELPIEEDFKKVYGSIKLKFNVKSDIAYLEDIEPSNLLHDMYTYLLPTCKGIPYRNNRDLFKIKMIKGVLK